MSFGFRDLWTWQGKIDRVPYAVVGLAGFAIKHNLDRILAWRLHRPWGLFSYWIPLGQAARIAQLSPSDSRFLAVMVAVSIPFIWVGVVLTLKRLRSAGLPPWLVALFFVPMLNVLFCAVMALWPPRGEMSRAHSAHAQPQDTWLDRIIPRSGFGSALLAVFLTAALTLGLTKFSTLVLLSYGWGLFIALPFFLGLGSVLLYGYHESRSLGGCIIVCMSALGVVALALLALAVEGVICILMAAPIAIVLGLMGGILGYEIQRYAPRRDTVAATLSAILLLLPGAFAVESASHATPTTFSVRTAIEINAPPERVWNQVVAFTQIPEPREFLFRAGIAYPIRAEMRGTGVGAERHCVFSTGAFVEPIEVWDAPHLLKFSVTSNPAPMQEWTPYPKIQPPHLHGFLMSNGGQFLLTPLSGGRTRLEGTTWYRHSLWPESYWRVWSDYIIHRIHLRVLRHIEEESLRQSQIARASLP